MSLRVSEEWYRDWKRKKGLWTAGPDIPPEPKASKYHNKKVAVDGLTFDSQAEARRYGELRLLEQAGKIHHLTRQVPMPCDVNDKPVCNYIADFCYTENGKAVVEDVKGVATPTYRIKKKLVEALYGIKIKEVKYRG